MELRVAAETQWHEATAEGMGLFVRHTYLL